MTTPTYVRQNDRYGLTAPDHNGYHYLYRRVTPDPSDPEFVDYEVGAVANAENFDYACDAADEEAAVLLADARAEFGF